MYTQRVMATARDERVYTRMTELEKAKAEALAEELGDESISQVIRRLVRERYKEVFGDKPPRKRSSRSK